MRNIGKNIRLLRMKQNMTQDELAERLFVSRQTVSNYETGRSRPDIDTLMRISESLGTEVQDLLYGPSDPQTRTDEIRRFIIAGCALLLVAALCGVMERFGISWKMGYFQFSAAECLRLLLRPGMYLLMGWAVMQGLSLLPKTKMIPYHVPYARYAAMAVIVAYFLMMSIFCSGILWMDWSSWQHALSGSQEGFSASFFVPGVTPCVVFISRHLNKYLWIIFIALGMILWLSAGKTVCESGEETRH